MHAHTQVCVGTFYMRARTRLRARTPFCNVVHAQNDAVTIYKFLLGKERIHVRATCVCACKHFCGHMHVCTEIPVCVHARLNEHRHVCMRSHMYGGHTCIRACTLILLVVPMDTFSWFRMCTFKQCDCPHTRVYAHMHAHTCRRTQFYGPARRTRADVKNEHALVHAQGITKIALTQCYQIHTCVCKSIHACALRTCVHTRTTVYVGHHEGNAP